MSFLLPLLLLSIQQRDTVVVTNTDELRRAVLAATPGTEISVAPGEYQGGLTFSNIHGKPGKPIIIRHSPRTGKAIFRGGGSGMQFSNVSHLQIDGLTFIGATGNGLNIDDGGNREKPSHHIELMSITVTDLPKGNHDGIKLSGVTDFRVINAYISKWGGSGIDMVGCHRGEINRSKFLNGGDSGVQAKGGSSEIAVVKCEFRNYGQRGVNIGGSTGREFFRPPLEKIPAGQRFEAKDIRVEGSYFFGGTTPFAFVGVDGAKVSFNTIENPERWALRILQETNASDFLPSRNGVFEDNLVVWYRKETEAVNVGPGTEPTSFRFARNFWFVHSDTNTKKPNLPSLEVGGVYDVDPIMTPDRGNIYPLRPSHPEASKRGFYAYKEKS